MAQKPVHEARRRIGGMIRKEFLQIRQDRRMLGISIIAPFLQVLLLGYAATTDLTNANLVVCDLDRTPESRTFIRRFTTSGYFVERFRADVPDEADRYIEHARASMALVVPDGFGDRILGRQPAQVQVVLDGADANTSSILLSYATLVINSYSQDVLTDVASTVRGLRVGRITPEPRIWFNPDLKSAHYMVPGVVALVLMVVTMMLTSLGIVREKEMGTLEQLMVTPIKPYQLILGKLIPFTVIGFVDVVVVLSLAHFWFGVPIRGSLPLLFGLSGIFILTTLGLGLFVSTIARSQQQAMLISMFFFFIPFMFLGGFVFPISNMPGVIQPFTYLMPLRYFFEIVRGLLLKGAGLDELWPQGLALVAFGVGIFALSVRRFRKTLA